jgi:hypothetical protein
MRVLPYSGRVGGPQLLTMKRRVQDDLSAASIAANWASAMAWFVVIRQEMTVLTLCWSRTDTSAAGSL